MSISKTVLQEHKVIHTWGGGGDGSQNCRFYNVSACSLHSTSKISVKSTSTKKVVYLQSTTK